MLGWPNLSRVRLDGRPVIHSQFGELFERGEMIVIFPQTSEAQSAAVNTALTGGRTTHSEPPSRQVLDALHAVQIREMRLIDSCLDDFAHHDFAHKGFCNSPPSLLIVVAASPIGFAASTFSVPHFFCQLCSIHRETDSGMQVMISKPSRPPGIFVAHHEWQRADLAKSWRAKS